MTNFMSAEDNLVASKSVAYAVKKERARRNAVRLIEVIFLIIIFDGSVRKYALPELEQYANFLRDPFVAWLYAVALTHGFIRRHWILTFGLFLAVVTSVLAVLQLLAGSNVTLSLLIFGFRQYFVLMPLPFVMMKVLRQHDLDRLLRLALWILIAMAPLMVVQVLSPPGSWVNIGRGLDVERFVLLGYGDFVRAPGFFTAAMGPAYYLPFCGAILLSCWMLPRDRRPCSTTLLLLAAGALCVAQSVAGNRTSIVISLFVLLASIPAAVLMVRSSRSAPKSLIGIVLLCMVGLTVATLLFPDQYDAFYNRWSGANALTDAELGISYGPFAIFARAVRDMLSVVDLIFVTPLVGFGLGLGTNAATILIAADSFLPPHEPPFARHIIDLGPVVGVIYIVFFRLILATWLGMIAWRTSRQHHDPRAWMLYSVTGTILLTGLIQEQSTASGLVWYWIGLILATAAQKNPMPGDTYSNSANSTHAVELPHVAH
jgi:hypothetical protein